LVIDQVKTDKYYLVNGDCVEGMKGLPDKSVHFTIYSPPFCGLYQYSSHERDLSNCDSYEQFFEHYGYVVKEIARITLPGRLSAVHCMDTPNSNSGRDSYSDFPGDIIRLHTRCRDKKCKASTIDRENGKCGHGWFDYIGRHGIWKEPLAVRLRTMQKNLAHQTLTVDSSLCGIASMDYLLLFRNKGDNPIPVEHPTGLMNYIGEREIPKELYEWRGHEGKQTENRFSHWIWRQYASSFWDDIRIEKVLPYREARDSEDEKHVHPLQLDVIHRAITLRTNPGEVVLTPFMGVGSEVYGAVSLGRKGVGFELKESYYRQAVKNVSFAEVEEHEQGDLFNPK
jgi:DNA modification methylase